MTTEWTDAQGRDHTVTTHRGNGQSEEAWQAHHDAAVAAAQDIWPPA